MPLTGGRQSADEDKRPALPSPRSPQGFQSESVVVVLGVLYPSVLSQPGESNHHSDLVPLLPGLVTGRSCVGVVFYDPLSLTDNGCEIPSLQHRRNSAGDGHEDRAENRKAVARDLALLSFRKRLHDTKLRNLRLERDQTR